MEWFSGNIEEAVRTGKQRNVIFVVFVDGNNEESAPFAALINSPEIVQMLNDQSRYLAIRIESSSDSYKMFAQIYRLVPVPSMFFIGHNGQPLEIVASNIKTVAELQEKMQKAEATFFKQPDSSTSSAPTSNPAPVPAPTPAPAKPAKVDKPAAEPTRETKEDLDMQKLKAERKREKAEDEEARRRVLEQIKLDRMRRQDQQEPVAKKPATTPTEPAPVRPSSDMTRIQFRKPTGETVIDTFKSEGPFGDVWKYAKASLGVKDFVLATSMPPRKEFSAEHSQQTLVELNLAPSAVLLVIPLTKPSVIGTAVSNRGGVVATVTGFLFTLFWMLMNPLLGLWNRITGKAPVKRDEGPAQEPTDPGQNIDRSEVLQKRNLARYNLGPSAGSSGTSGNKSNIHRLKDYDSDDKDKNTYNGNSTQQM